MSTATPHSVDSTTCTCCGTHEVTARQSVSSGLWMLSCSCGWSAPPCITVEEATAVGEAHYASLRGSGNRALVDVGPATPAPSWCLPGTEPDWATLAARYGGGQVCTWERKLDDCDLWVSCEDEVVGGRVLRAQPRIFGTEEPHQGWTAGQARELAAHLVVAADLIDQAVSR